MLKEKLQSGLQVLGKYFKLRLLLKSYHLLLNNVFFFLGTMYNAHETYYLVFLLNLI